MAQECPQAGPKYPQDGPRDAQDGPKSDKNSSKKPPRCAEETLRMAEKAFVLVPKVPLSHKVNLRKTSSFFDENGLSRTTGAACGAYLQVQERTEDAEKLSRRHLKCRATRTSLVLSLFVAHVGQIGRQDSSKIAPDEHTNTGLGGAGRNPRRKAQPIKGPELCKYL